MKRLFWLLCLCGYLPLVGQESPIIGEGEYWTLGIGIPIATVRDEAHSPLAYRGLGIRFWLTYEDIRPRGVWRIQTSFNNIGMKAYVRPRRRVKQSTNLRDFQFDFGYYRGLGGRAEGRDNQYAGARITLRTFNRQFPLPTNNVNSLLLATSFDVGVMDRRQFNNARWSATSSLDLPVVTALLRSTYIGVLPVITTPNAELGDLIPKMRLVTVDKFFHPDLRVQVDYAARPWRFDRIQYQGDFLYTPLPTGKPLISTSGSLGYGYRVLQ